METNTPEGQVQTPEVPMTLGDALSAQFDVMQEEMSDPNPAEQAADVESHGTDDPEAAELREELEAENEELKADEPEWDEPAPERWPEEMKKAYADLPPAAKKLMMESVYKPMQAQYTKTTMELAEQRKTLEPFQEALKQHEEVFKSSGANPAEVFQNTMAWAAHLTRVGPEQGLKDMRASYGLTDEEGNEKPDEYLTPTERKLKSRLDDVERKNHQQQQEQQKAAQQEQEQRFIQYRNYIRSEVDGFVNEQVDGKLAHPHANELQPQIRGLIEGGLVKKADEYGRPVPFGQQLREAYGLAVKMNPKYGYPVTDRGQVEKAKAASNVNVQTQPVSRQSEIADVPLPVDLEKTYDLLDKRTR